MSLHHPGPHDARGEVCQACDGMDLELVERRMGILGRRLGEKRVEEDALFSVTHLLSSSCGKEVIPRHDGIALGLESR